MEYPEMLLIDKPVGMTSFDVVYAVRRKLNPKPPVDSPDRKKWTRLKVGHAGTLDPLASGLMIIGVGKGTKKLTDITKCDKEYIAQVRIGERRTTGDLEGIVTDAVAVTTNDISQKDITTAVARLIGTHRLPVSAYSAIKKEGVPMYKRARMAEKRGEEVPDVPVRDMTVYEAQVLAIENIVVNYDILEDVAVTGGTESSNCANRVVVTVRFAVASGVYIRSLGEELGRLLGYPATLQALRRTKVGPFVVADAQHLEDIQ